MRRLFTFDISRFQKPFPLVFGGFLIPLVWSRYLNDNFTEPKWFALRLTAGLSLAYLALRRKPILLPRFNLALGLTLSLWLALSLLNPILQGTFYWPADLWLDRAAVCALTICFFQFESVDELFLGVRWPVSLAAITVCAISLTQFILYRVIESQPSVRFFAGTFGENNMCAQFLCLALAVVLPLRQSAIRTRWFYWSSLVSVVIFTFLNLHQSRSALIGAGLIVTLLTFLHGKREFIRIGCIAALGLLLSVGLQSLQKTAAVPTDKSNSTADRKELYLETANMIWQVPFGVGSGRYEFDSIPFLKGGKFQAGEAMVYKSPHSEPLRFLAEEGIAWSIVAGLAMLMIFGFKQLFRSLRAGDPQAIAISAVCLALTPEFLFQFPLENAVPLYFFGFLVAARLKRIENPVVSQGLSKYVIGFIAVVVVSFASLFAFSNYQATTAVRSEEYVSACHRSTYNWFLCTSAARAAIESGDTKTGRALMLDELSRRPFDYMALRNLGIAEWTEGKKERACEYFVREQLLLGPENTNREFTESNCTSTIVDRPLTLNALALYRDHLRWTKSIIENGGPKSTTESRDQK